MTHTSCSTESDTNVDKPWITIGPDASNPDHQAVWITYAKTVSGNQQVFATGASVSGVGSVGAFLPPVQVSTSGTQNNNAIPAVGPNGGLAVTWLSPSSGQGQTTIQFARDLDGLTGGISFEPNSSITTSNAGGKDLLPAVPESGASASPYLVYDRSGLANSGRLYVAYAEESVNESNNFDIRLSHSDNNGDTWSAPVTVNDDGGSTSQFMQSLAIDQTNGAVWLSWYDARNDVTNTKVQYFASVSVDGGLNFLPNVQVSNGTSDETRSNPDVSDFGGYTGITAFGGAAYATWADNSNSTNNVQGANPATNKFPLEVYAERLSLDWANGVMVTLTGTSDTDVWLIRKDLTGEFLQFYEKNSAEGKPAYTARLADVSSIVINGNEGNDQILLEGLGADFTGTITVDGGDGADLLYDLHGVPPASISNLEAISHATVTADNLPPQWQEQGPGVALGGLVSGIKDKPVAGAIQAVLVDPTNPLQMFIASVNGGVWRTQTGGLDWEPLTDNFPSLSFSVLAYDQNELGLGFPKKTIYAGTGKVSSYGSVGKAIGIMKGVEADDGSITWKLIQNKFFDDNPIRGLEINGEKWWMSTRRLSFTIRGC